MKIGTCAYLSRFVAVAAAGFLAGAGPVFAAGATVGVSGDSKPSDCGAAGGAAYGIELSGSLAGCWSVFPAHFNCQEMNGFSLYTEIGRETFEGKLDGQDAKFETQYTFNGLFPSGSCPEPNAEKEIVGGCTHYISGSSVVGVMRFYDVMSGEGAPHFFYEGTLNTM